MGSGRWLRRTVLEGVIEVGAGPVTETNKGSFLRPGRERKRSEARGRTGRLWAVLDILGERFWKGL